VANGAPEGPAIRSSKESLMMDNAAVRAQRLGRSLVGLVRPAASASQAPGQPGMHLVGVPATGRLPSQVTMTPVVLVHGYRSSGAGWSPLVSRLHAAGFANVMAMHYDGLSSGVPELAAALTQVVSASLASTGHTRVHLVGHSLGGLLSRYAVQRLGLDRLTSTVVTVAAPERGVPIAWLGRGPAALQMRTGSSLFRELPPLKRTGTVRWAVIHGTDDRVVTAPAGGDALLLRGYGHHSILGAPELADVVLAHLAAAEWAAREAGRSSREPTDWGFAVRGDRTRYSPSPAH
jgi:pimeloyl-ACP methyl ester carboxylesterase